MDLVRIEWILLSFCKAGKQGKRKKKRLRDLTSGELTSDVIVGIASSCNTKEIVGNLLGHTSSTASDQSESRVFILSNHYLFYIAYSTNPLNSSAS